MATGGPGRTSGAQLNRRPDHRAGQGPAVLLITDEAGEIVYRNRAAAAMLANTVREYGEQAPQVLRDELREIVRRVGTVPATQSIPTMVNGAACAGRVRSTGFPAGTSSPGST
jgi:hypothetical protein